MDTQRLPRDREKENQEASKEDGATSPPPPPPPPSSTSSPSHEFSFTISLHPCSNSNSTNIKCNKTSPTFEIDLAPADDIFFHGHLLPLHLLSCPTISPRPSDISIEDFNLPIKHIYGAQSPRFNPRYQEDATEPKRSKLKSTTSFFGFKRWQKTTDILADDDKEEKKNKKKKTFDISRFLKKYANMVLFFKGEKENRDLRRRPYSFSCNLNSKGGDVLKRGRGQYSAPVSRRTSPTNSGLLLATPAAFSSSSGESSMEELQSAIQAAIAHCKNSVAIKEEKCKF